MTEARARQKLKAIQRRAKKGLCKHPTTFHMAMDGEKVKCALIASDGEKLWSWPPGYRVSVHLAEETGKWGKFDMKAFEGDQWNLVPLGQSL